MCGDAGVVEVFLGDDTVVPDASLLPRGFGWRLLACPILNRRQASSLTTLNSLVARRPTGYPPSTAPHGLHREGNLSLVGALQELKEMCCLLMTRHR